MKELNKRIKKSGMSVSAIHRELVRRGWDGTDRTLRNYLTGATEIPHSIYISIEKITNKRSGKNG